MGGGSSDFLEVKDLCSLPKGNWSSVERELRSICEESGFTMLPPAYAQELLPFVPSIFSASGGRPVTIFDVLFFLDD